MQCPSCNKLCGFEIQDPEIDVLSADGGVVAGDIRLVLNTACCGDEAKENVFSVEEDITEAIKAALVEAGVVEPDLDQEGVTFEITSEDATADERYQSTTPKGKPISSRYQKKFYTVSLEYTIHVTYPVLNGDPVEVDVDGIWEDEIQASYMEQIC